MYFGKPVAVTSAILTSSNVAETVAAWSLGTVYASGAKVRREIAGIERVCTSAQGTNQNHDPATDDGTWWTIGGPTNRYKMFDGSRGSQTENADSIVVSLTLPGLVNAVAIQNVDADEIRIVQTDPVEGDVYDETFTMVSNSGITDPWAYSFTPITRIADLTMIELKPYADSTLTVTLSNTGSTARCGELAPAWLRDYGGTRWGAAVAIQDYSVKEADGLGGYDVVERAYARRMTLQVIVETVLVDTLVDDLARLRATRTLFVGDQDFGATALIGFVKDWSVELGLDVSLLNIEIESLA